MRSKLAHGQNVDLSRSKLPIFKICTNLRLTFVDAPLPILDRDRCHFHYPFRICRYADSPAAVADFSAPGAAGPENGNGDSAVASYCSGVD